MNQRKSARSAGEKKRKSFPQITQINAEKKNQRKSAESDGEKKSCFPLIAQINAENN